MEVSSEFEKPQWKTEAWFFLWEEIDRVFYRIWTCYPKLRRLVLYPSELRILKLNFDGFAVEVKLI